MTRRLWLPLVLLLAFGGCRENVVGPQLSGALAASAPRELHILQQSPTAPPLETYQVSFWARHDRPSTITVDYQPAAGQSAGRPFLRFYIPKFGLMWAPDGARLRGSDSVFITLTIDTLNLSVDFQPSGVAFSQVFSARLAIWYANANPDLNGDGGIDTADDALQQELALWSQATQTAAWRKVLSSNDTTQLYVASALYHFSSYAVSW